MTTKPSEPWWKMNPQFKRSGLEIGTVFRVTSYSPKKDCVAHDKFKKDHDICKLIAANSAPGNKLKNHEAILVTMENSQTYWRLDLFLICLFLLIEFRLIQTAIENDNWRGWLFSTLHLVIVALVARWGIVRSNRSRQDQPSSGAN